jgi:predicted amidophosphoribosyltransferase
LAEERTEEERLCPNCEAGLPEGAANICPNCGEELAEEEGAADFCSDCGAELPEEGANSCPNCWAEQQDRAPTDERPPKNRPGVAPKDLPAGRAGHRGARRTIP